MQSLQYTVSGSSQLKKILERRKKRADNGNADEIDGSDGAYHSLRYLRCCVGAKRRILPISIRLVRGCWNFVDAFLLRLFFVNVTFLLILSYKEMVALYSSCKTLLYTKHRINCIDTFFCGNHRSKT